LSSGIENPETKIYFYFIFSLWKTFTSLLRNSLKGKDTGKWFAKKFDIPCFKIIILKQAQKEER